MQGSNKKAGTEIGCTILTKMTFQVENIHLQQLLGNYYSETSSSESTEQARNALRLYQFILLLRRKNKTCGKKLIVLNYILHVCVCGGGGG